MMLSKWGMGKMEKIELIIRYMPTRGQYMDNPAILEELTRDLARFIADATLQGSITVNFLEKSEYYRYIHPLYDEFFQGCMKVYNCNTLFEIERIVDIMLGLGIKKALLPH